MIKVTARIANDKGLLMDGMNVKVIAENDVKKALVVPKDAVIERDGYHVVSCIRMERLFGLMWMCLMPTLGIMPSLAVSAKVLK